MKPEENDIAVIIINYNSSEFTLDCVRSIFSRTPGTIDFQLIIVDNASAPGEIIKLKELEGHPLVEVIYSGINLGFGGGNMLGAGRAKARFLFFLNNDCLLLNDCLGSLLAFGDNNPQAGLCGPQQYSREQNRINSFNYLPTPALKFLGADLLRLFDQKRYPNRYQHYVMPLKVEAVSGSGLFFNHEAFIDIGGFDPNLFFYCEEEDLGLRLKKKGWKVYLIPGAKYIHFGGASSSENLVMLKEYYISLMYFFRKHFSGIAYFFLKLLYAVKFLRKSLRNRKYFPFVGFILRNAPMENSLRFK